MSRFVTSQPHSILNVYSRGNTESDAVRPRTTERGSPAIVLEAEDGANTKILQVKSFMLFENDGKRTKALYACDKSEFYITDARIALACEKYDKGGGDVGADFIIGGAGFTAVNNLMSKAAHRAVAHGNILAGHIRYRNLRSIKGRRKYGPLSGNEIYVTAEVKAGGQTYVQELQIQLGKEDDPLAYVADLYRRVGSYKLKHGMHNGSEPDAQRLKKMRSVVLLTPPANPKTFTGGPAGSYLPIQFK